MDKTYFIFFAWLFLSCGAQEQGGNSAKPLDTIVKSEPLFATTLLITSKDTINLRDLGDVSKRNAVIHRVSELTGDEKNEAVIKLCELLKADSIYSLFTGTAACLLGELKDPTAIPVLLDAGLSGRYSSVDDDLSPDILDLPYMYCDFPEAIAKFGETAVIPVEDSMMKQDSYEQIAFCVRTIQYIKGFSKQEYIDYLEEKKTKSAIPAKAHFEKLIAETKEQKWNRE